MVDNLKVFIKVLLVGKGYQGVYGKGKKRVTTTTYNGVLEVAQRTAAKVWKLDASNSVKWTQLKTEAAEGGVWVTYP